MCVDRYKPDSSSNSNRVLKKHYCMMDRYNLELENWKLYCEDDE